MDKVLLLGKYEGMDQFYFELFIELISHQVKSDIALFNYAVSNCFEKDRWL